MKKENRLSGSEKEIMEVVWESRRKLFASEVFKKLENKNWKYTTVATFLTRLVKKDFLFCEKSGAQNCYSEKISRAEYLSHQTEDFVNDMYNGSAKELIACLCRERITGEDYDELMGMLAKYEKGGKDETK